MAVDWDDDALAPLKWRHVPLKVTADMPLARRVAREIHNVAMAYGDTVSELEHALAAKHFDAIVRGDAAAAAEALAARIALGFAQ